MSPTVITEVFAKLYGIPCWHVHQGHGSFLTFEFGSPRHEVGPVRELTPDDPRSPRRQRLVTVHGEWHLWIYCCGWRIAQDGNVLAANESTRECIAGACRKLDGQALSEMTFSAEGGGSRFRFDLGGKLNTGPYDEELYEQWMLFCPDGLVLSYRSDGKFSYHQSNAVDAPFEQVDAV